MPSCVIYWLRRVVFLLFGRDVLSLVFSMLGYVLPASEAASCGFKSSIGFSRQLFKQSSTGTKTSAPCGGTKPCCCPVCHPQASVLPSLAQDYCSISLVPKHSVSFHFTRREWGTLLKTPQAPGVQHLPPDIGEMLEMSEPDLCRKGSRKLKAAGGRS